MVDYGAHWSPCILVVIINYHIHEIWTFEIWSFFGSHIASGFPYIPRRFHAKHDRIINHYCNPHVHICIYMQLSLVNGVHTCTHRITKSFLLTSKTYEGGHATYGIAIGWAYFLVLPHAWCTWIMPSKIDKMLDLLVLPSKM